MSHPTDDLDLIMAADTQQRPVASGRRLLWVVWAFMVLAVVVAAALVLYLQRFEQEEDTKRRAADAQWLEQTMQFHLRRLEADMQAMARYAQVAVDNSDARSNASDPTQLAGLLWREPGVVLQHSWQGADHALSPWLQAWLGESDKLHENQRIWSSLQRVVQGLRRPEYGGPLQTPATMPHATDDTVVLLAVPHFERGHYMGSYVALLSMQQAVDTLLPDWFTDHHRVRVVAGGELAATDAGQPYRAALNLNGLDLYLDVQPHDQTQLTVPRLFLGVALLLLVGLVATLWLLRRDMQMRLQVQANLQEEVALRKAMENSVTIGLRAWDMAGRVLYVNEAFCRMVGYRADELLGQSAPMPYWPEEDDGPAQRHRSMLEQGKSRDGIEVQFQHRDGHLVDVLIHEAPLLTASGEQRGWIGSVLDVSERKRAQALAQRQQERLQASGRLVVVGEVASTLAHELNQPLGALSSFATGLLNRMRNGTITQPEMTPVVERMASLAERAGRVVQRVNAIARRREITLQQVELQALLQRVVPAAMLVPTSPPSYATLPTQPVWVQGDGLLLEHLLGNLISNAQDAVRQAGLPPGTPHTVEVRLHIDQHDSTGAKAHLCVADAGPGVDEGALEHIFEAFYSTKEGGMGMGLAICRSIVEAHRGQLLVERDPLLGGACLHVVLPVINPSL
ncbi:PAS domain S-box protein [Curvibacter sp. CHRR-16]|uniref:two-component system sensor histidine kinase NtrB n=1 Tax=Curvibacter sp. CHRR-16 TaxID=2835872 RepID=UPI001BDB3B9B|nr:PAS domain S-box protein [Curvibacter sp. CHRR-16]MBT0570247.1 PAS domain S-box protein [Curvibacter sp. CHRR-16]